MEQTNENDENRLKKVKMQKTARVIWMVLVPVFAAVIFWRLFGYANGKDTLTGILPPLGMIFVGLSFIVDERRKTLRSVLIALAMVLVVAGLIFVFL